MDKELRSIRMSQQPPIPAKDMVTVVRRLYPKFDKPLLSKCEHGDEYGIQIRHDAMDALTEHFVPQVLNIAPASEPTAIPEVPKKKHSGKHRLSCRISCRLEDGEYEALQQLVRADGFDTMQAWLSHKIRQYLKRKKAKEQTT